MFEKATRPMKIVSWNKKGIVPNSIRERWKGGSPGSSRSDESLYRKYSSARDAWLVLRTQAAYGRTTSSTPRHSRARDCDQDRA
jgi:hypothetical protein